MIKVHDGNKEILKEFKSECSKCSGLCCTALFFSKLDGFPENKVAGKPCINLQKDYKCRIHKNLEKNNMRGCIGYDCFGAGQKVIQHIYNGHGLYETPDKAQEIFDVFIVMFQLCQIGYFLAEAMTIKGAEAIRKDLEKLYKENRLMCEKSPEEILSADMDKYRDRVNVYLKKASSLMKDHHGFNNKKCPRDFMGKNYKNKDITGFDLSTKLLIAADFQNCDFSGVNLLGADTRDTNFSGGDLREAVFLTQGQINAARGDRNTRLPQHLSYPVTWK